MKPDQTKITLKNNVRSIKNMMSELIIEPRKNLAKWAKTTKQTPGAKIGYVGQHLASLITGVEGARTGARGHDLSDHTEVKSCSRLDQLDTCADCKSAVARLEQLCPSCKSNNIARKNDSKWLLAARSKQDLSTLLKKTPRILFLLADYPNFSANDWNTLQFQAFEIWPRYNRHKNFGKLIENYYENIYKAHISKTPSKTPAPKNFWPYSYQFFLCNPVRTFHCTVKNSLGNRHSINVHEYVKPKDDRAKIKPCPMPLKLLSNKEVEILKKSMSDGEYAVARNDGLDERQRMALPLRDTDHAAPQTRSYRRKAP